MTQFVSYKIPNDRPSRETIISRDEVMSLKIDMEVLGPDEFIEKYLKISQDPQGASSQNQ
ncbi:MAG: hypothetical protein GF398_01340 [Chitinivibrionales bacterium]|nr:hypothetical protein [Chitinivibrionales bacterium]